MNNKEVLRSSWVWNDSVTNFVKSKIEGYCLNVPCGLSDLGNVKCDLDPKKDDIKKVDMNKLPFNDCSFDTIIQDPPWKIGFYQRMKPFFECVRVCKVGGRIIYNATWIPSCPSGDVELLKLYARQDNNFSNTSIISVFKKVQDNIDYNKMQEGKIPLITQKHKGGTEKSLISGTPNGGNGIPPKPKGSGILPKDI